MSLLRFAGFTWVAAVCWLVFPCAGGADAHAAGPDRPIEVEAQRKPDSDWKSYGSTTVERLLGRRISGFKAPALSAYGGLLDEQLPATGYFSLRKIQSRWWFVDPEGHPLIRMSLGAVYRRTRSSGMDDLPADVRAHVQAQGGARWAAGTVELFRDLRVNSLGRWSEYEVFNDTGARIPYTTSLKFMAAFGSRLDVTHEKYGHQGYREDCIPVFHPDFPAFCDAYAKESAAPLADDPYLVGHYTDNEMPVPRDLLAATLALDPDDEALKHNHSAAWEWFRQRRGRNASVDDVTKADGEAYLGLVFDRYHAVTSAALRKHDPNHLIMGTRLHGAGLKIAPVIEAAGKHVDVVSFNCYGYWDLSSKMTDAWVAAADRPFVISEFCIKGNDTGLDNTKGAGWSVRTQEDRGVWYQNFLISLLQSRHCVGWDYFKYRDDVDVNKGVLTYDFKPHPAFYAAMKQAHESAYLVIQHLDSKKDR